MTADIFSKCQMKHICKHTFEMYLFVNRGTDLHVKHKEGADGEMKGSGETEIRLLVQRYSQDLFPQIVLIPSEVLDKPPKPSTTLKQYMLMLCVNIKVMLLSMNT